MTIADRDPVVEANHRHRYLGQELGYRRQKAEKELADQAASPKTAVTWE